MSSSNITIIILTKNESGHLGELLPTLKWADKLLIIDDYSTDDTRGVAKSFSATVIKRHLNKDFAAQRNAALKKVRTKWVLFLDPDERVSTGLAREITAVIRDDKSLPGYAIKREDIFLEKQLKFGETKNIWLIRLAQRDAGRWKRPVHEVWDIKDAGRLHEPIQHFAHSSIRDLSQAVEQYAEIEANYRHSNGDVWSLAEQLTFPLGKFFYTFVLKGGFFDGFPGLIMSYMMSVHSWKVRSKLYVLSHPNIHRQSFFTLINQWLIALTIGLLAIGHLQRIQISQTIAFNIFDVVIASSILLWIIESIIKKRVPQKYPLAVGMITFSAVLIASFIINSSRITNLVTPLLHLGRWILYAVYSWYLYDQKSRHVWPWSYKSALTLIVKLSVIFGFIQYLFFPDTRSLWYLGWDEHYYRLIGALFDPGFLGLLFSLGLLLIEEKAKTWKTGWYIILLSGLLLTYARSAYIVYGFTLIMTAISNKDWRSLLAKVTICTVGIICLPNPGGEGVNLARTNSIISRAESAVSAYDIAKSNPVWGVGFNDYPRYVMSQIDESNTFIPKHPSAPDNSYLFIAATSGMMGIMGLLILLANIALVLKDDQVSMISFLAILAHGLSNNTFFYPWILLWLLFLIANSARNTNQSL